MVYSLVNVVILLELFCRAQVQFGVVIWIALAQLFVQKVAEQVVVAVGRRSASPKTGNEEIAPFHLCQKIVRFLDLQDLTAQLGRHLAQNSRCTQKVLNVGWLQAQHLAGQVVVRLGGSLFRVEQDCLGLVAQQVGQQQDAGDPAFRVGGNRFCLAFGCFDLRQLQQVADFLGRETQVLDRQADELSLGNQARDGDIGQRAAAQHQVAIRGEDLDQAVDERLDVGGAIQRLVIVHHDGKGSVNL